MVRVVEKNDSFIKYEMTQKEIKRCPNVIFDPLHYMNVKDGYPCRCYDKNAKEMKEYGYRWKVKKGYWD